MDEDRNRHGLAVFENDGIGSFSYLISKRKSRKVEARSKDNIHEIAIQYLKGESSVRESEAESGDKAAFSVDVVHLRRKPVFFLFH